MPRIIADRFETPHAGELALDTRAVTVTGTCHTITPGDLQSGNLDTIHGGADGQILVLRPAPGKRIAVKNNKGNLLLAGADFAMENSQDVIVLIYQAALGYWIELSRSKNGA